MTAGAPQQRAHGFLGSLKDALAAAARDDTARQQPVKVEVVAQAAEAHAKAETPAPAQDASQPKMIAAPQSPSAAEAARDVRGSISLEGRHVEADAPPTTRVVRGGPKPAEAAPQRTTLVRGKANVKRGAFEHDPVVAWLVVVGGPGIGQFRPVFEGNNTIGRSANNRIPVDFGDDAISSEEQAYIRYDSADRSFLFVPNLAKTNVVSLNDKKPTGAVPLAQMDVITMGRTQLVFVPFCGPNSIGLPCKSRAQAETGRGGSRRGPIYNASVRTCEPGHQRRPKLSGRHSALVGAAGSGCWSAGKRRGGCCHAAGTEEFGCRRCGTGCRRRACRWYGRACGRSTREPDGLR